MKENLKLFGVMIVASLEGFRQGVDDVVTVLKWPRWICWILCIITIPINILIILIVSIKEKSMDKGIDIVNEWMDQAVEEFKET